MFETDNFTANEKRVFQLIPLGMERPITTEEVCDILNLDSRSVHSIIESLITSHNIPIGANRNGINNGYFIPSSETERNAGLYSLAKQTDTMTKRLDTVKNADLKRARQLKEQLALSHAEQLGGVQLTLLNFERISH